MLLRWLHTLPIQRFSCSLPKVQILAKALAPAIFRIGGNEADLLIFNQSAEEVYERNTRDNANWPDNDVAGEEDWYDPDLDYDAVFTDLNDTWTNFTMTGITERKLLGQCDLIESSELKPGCYS